MNRLLQIIPRASHRTITVSYADGRDERYALYRFDSGDVCWRLDAFQIPDDPRGIGTWIDSHGRLTVAEVIERLPAHARTIRDWTRKEIALGTVVVDDIFSEMTRGEALARLAAELDASEAARRQSA